MSDEIQRSRSPNSARINITDAIETVGVLYQKAGRSALTRLAAAKALGYSGFTGSSLTILGALNQYGLIDQTKGDVRVSELALQILHPVDAKGKLSAIRKAVLSPKAFAEINEKWHGLDEDTLTNQLIHNKFTPDAAKRTAAVYKINCEVANLGKPDSLGKDASSDVAAPHIISPVSVTEQPSKKTMSAEPSFGGELPIPLGSGHVARVPFPMTEDDFDLFVNTLNLWKKKLVRKPDPIVTAADATGQNLL